MGKKYTECRKKHQYLCIVRFQNPPYLCTRIPAVALSSPCLTVRSLGIAVFLRRFRQFPVRGISPPFPSPRNPFIWRSLYASLCSPALNIIGIDIFFGVTAPNLSHSYTYSDCLPLISSGRQSLFSVPHGKAFGENPRRFLRFHPSLTHYMQRNTCDAFCASPVFLIKNLRQTTTCVEKSLENTGD